MDDSPRHRWPGPAMLAGGLYLAAGLTSWRLAAWLISVAVFAAHIAYEHVRLRNPSRPTAWHVATAVALGAFGLALVANIHDLGRASGYRPRMLIALVAWPLLTAVPAFLVALGVAAGLGASPRPR